MPGSRVTKGSLFSHSRLSCFENCPLQYKYKYIDKLKVEEFQTIEAFLGTMVHKTLEKLYRDLKFSKENSLKELLEFYNKEWDKQWKPSIVINRDYEGKNFRKMGEVYISDYYKRFHPFDQSKTIGLEQRVIVNLADGGKLQMQGYIDRLSSPSEGVYEIHDYKTSGTMPPIEHLHRDRQLALYSIAVKNSYQDAKEIKLIWHYLVFNKDVEIQKSDEELERLKKDTSASVFPP